MFFEILFKIFDITTGLPIECCHNYVFVAVVYDFNSYRFAIYVALRVFSLNNVKFLTFVLRYPYSMIIIFLLKKREESTPPFFYLVQRGSSYVYHMLNFGPLLLINRVFFTQRFSVIDNLHIVQRHANHGSRIDN